MFKLLHKNKKETTNMPLVINENTKVMARFYPSVNNRGLSIYNPYFQETGVNAVYLLFPNSDPKILIDGMRNLNLAGAIIAGSFEKDPRVPELIDELHPLSDKVKRVGILVNNGGKIWGVYQGAFGLDESIRRLTDYSNKRMVLMGAGTVVRGLLSWMEMNNSKPSGIEIYNRTLDRAEKVAKEFPFVSKVGPLQEMAKQAKGDIFINATNVGSPWNKGDNYVFEKSFVSKFDYVVDVTFVPLKPQLVQVAEKLHKKVSPGHRMFLYQGKYALEKILGIQVDEEILSKKMLADFKTNWS
jgi:shikimate 5-dehydrogenase